MAYDPFAEPTYFWPQYQYDPGFPVVDMANVTNTIEHLNLNHNNLARETPPAETSDRKMAQVCHTYTLVQMFSFLR